MIVTLLNNFLLELRNALCLNFHTEVSSCQHNAVRCFNNRINIIQPFLRLNFGNNLHLRPGFIDKRANLSYRICGTNERGRHKIKVFCKTELNIFYILLRDRRQLNRYTGYIHTLSLSKFSPVRHLAKNLYSLYSFYFQAD